MARLRWTSSISAAARAKTPIGHDWDAAAKASRAQRRHRHSLSSNRPEELAQGAPAGEARARIVDDLSESEARRMLGEAVDLSAHLMSDEWGIVRLTSNGRHDTMSDCAAMIMPRSGRRSRIARS